MARTTKEQEKVVGVWHKKSKSVWFNILPAPSHSYTLQRPFRKYKLSFKKSLIVFVAASGSARLQDSACPHMDAVGPAPSLISLLLLWLKQAGPFCGGGREGGRKTREGKTSYCQTLDTVSDKSHKLVFLFLIPSFPRFFFVCFLHAWKVTQGLHHINQRGKNVECLERYGLAKSLNGHKSISLKEVVKGLCSC